jgi:hypothetical protein
MAMPSPSKTWYALSDKALASTVSAAAAANSYLHALFKTLIGQNHGSYTAGANGAPPSGSYWTVEFTCNGTTASSSDNFNNTFNNAEWVSNTAGSAHSWFVLKSPTAMLDGPWYLLVSKNSATATSWKIELSKSAYSGGTTTADPTSAGNVSSTGTVQRFDTSSTTAGKTHFMVEANGSFWFFGSRDGSGLISTWDSLNELAQTQPSGDSYRVFGYCGFSASGLFSSIATQSITGAQVLGFQRTGAAQVSSQMALTAHLFNITELNGINNEAEGVRGGLVSSTLAASQLVRGVIPDLYQMTTALTNGSNNPSAAAPVWIAIGSTSTGGKVALPFCGNMSL